MENEDTREQLAGTEALSVAERPEQHTISLSTLSLEETKLRMLIGDLIASLQGALVTAASKTAEEAIAMADSGDVIAAAQKLLSLGVLLVQVPYDHINHIIKIADHPDITVDERSTLLAALILIHQRGQEWVLARETAERLYALELEHDRPAIVAATLTTVAECLGHEGRVGEARAKLAEVIQFCRKHNLESELLWAYHTRGVLEWNEGNREQAIAEWERELGGRQGGPRYQLVHNTAFLASRCEQFDRRQAAKLYQQLVDDLLQSDITSDEQQMRSEAAYRLACLLLESTQWERAIHYAEIAIHGYMGVPNAESRLVWCHRLKEIAFTELKQEENAAESAAAAEKILSIWGHDRDKFRSQLATVFRAASLEERQAALGETEKLALSLDIEAHIEWCIAAAANAITMGDLNTALEHLRQGILLEKDMETWHDVRTRVHLHQVAADCLMKTENYDEAVAHANIAFNLDADDLSVTTLLAEGQIRTGRVTELQATMEALRRQGAPESVLWSVQVRAAILRRDMAAAIEVCREAYNKAHDAVWAIWRDECTDLNGGIVSLDQAPHAGPLWRLGQQLVDAASHETTSEILAVRPLLPTGDFYRRVVTGTFDRVVRSQGREPSFVRMYKSSSSNGPEIPLLEGDFRDHVDDAFSLVFPNTRTEEPRSRGPSDLLIPSTDESGHKVRFEFKIWGRNDYAGTVAQLLDYISDDEEIGIVYMINPLRTKDITVDYRQICILDQASYKTGSLGERPVRPDLPGPSHYLSVHWTPRGRPITVYHFIHNIWL